MSIKPFLGICWNESKDNETPDESPFLVAEPSEALIKSFEASTDKAIDTVNKSKLPLGLRIIKWISEIGALILVCGILKSDVSFKEGYHNAPYFYWGAIVCIVVFLVLMFLGRKKASDVLENEDAEFTMSTLESAGNAIYRELGVPTDARDVDILTYCYIEEDGIIKLKKPAMQLFDYFNPEFKAYADHENLYLANLDGKNAIPLADIRGIRTINKKARICEWNKEEPYNKGYYKQFKLVEDGYEVIICKEYHILDVRTADGTIGIYIPSYELPIFEELTHLKADLA